MARTDARRRQDLEYRRRRRGLEIDEEDEQALFEYQNGACYLCGEPITHKDWALDHNDATGEPRGIAHRTCNQAAGMFGDDPAMLRRVADAIESPPWRRLMDWEPAEPPPLTPDPQR